MTNELFYWKSHWNRNEEYKTIFSRECFQCIIFRAKVQLELIFTYFEQIFKANFWHFHFLGVVTEATEQAHWKTDLGLK